MMRVIAIPGRDLLKMQETARAFAVSVFRQRTLPQGWQNGIQRDWVLPQDAIQRLLFGMLAASANTGMQRRLGPEFMRTARSIAPTYREWLDVSICHENLRKDCRALRDMNWMHAYIVFSCFCIETGVEALLDLMKLAILEGNIDIERGDVRIEMLPDSE